MSNPLAVKQNTRNISLDIIRCVAILFVVLNHSVESYFNFLDKDTLLSTDSLRDSGSLILYTFGRLGVPLFLFITGYLLLHRDFDKPGAIKHFWIHNLLSLIVTWEIWLILYNYFLAYMNDTVFDVNMWVRQMLFVDEIKITHNWYITMIIAVYFFLPFIAKGIKNVAKPYLYIMLGVCLATLFVVPSINIFFSTFEIDTLNLRTTPVFIATFPVTFILAGHLFYLNKDKKYIPIGLRILIDTVVFAVSFALTVYFQVYFHKNGNAYMLWYTFFALFPASWCAFDLLHMIPFKKNIWLIKRISICSFGIYLTHRPIQMYLEQKVSFFYQTNVIPFNYEKMWILFAASFALSYGLSEGLAAIPIVGELLVRVRKKKIHLF